MFNLFYLKVPSASHQFEGNEKRHLTHQNTLGAPSCYRERISTVIKSNSVDHSDHLTAYMSQSIHAYQNVPPPQHNKPSHSSRHKHSKSGWFNNLENLRSSSVDVHPASKPFVSYLLFKYWFILCFFI